MNMLRVAFFGLNNKAKIKEILLPEAGVGELADFEWIDADQQGAGKDFATLMREQRPNVILSFGDWKQHECLVSAPSSVQNIWVGVNESDPGAVIAEKIMYAFMGCAREPINPLAPLVSVFTPANNSGQRIFRPYNSLKQQTYTNWEWVVLEDPVDICNPASETFNKIMECVKDDYRVNAFRSDRRCGSIGEMKRRCCGLARGEIFVELDHDDELTPNGLADIVAAFNQFLDAGFAYTDAAGFDKNGQMIKYGDGWGFGFGRMRYEFYKGKQHAINVQPPINSKTIRHITAAPNHIRAWRRDAYYAAGGHNSCVPVCDDFEIMIRTFLTTRMIHVGCLGYVQNLSAVSAQYERFKEIHRLVKYFKHFYDKRIHARFEELGVEDFCWNGEYGDLGAKNPDGAAAMLANYVYQPGKSGSLLANPQKMADTFPSQRVKGFFAKAAKQQAELNKENDMPPAFVTEGGPVFPPTPSKVPVQDRSSVLWERAGVVRQMSKRPNFTPALVPVAQQVATKMESEAGFDINDSAPAAIIVDDFWADPDAVRAFALQQEFVAMPEYFQGKRSERHQFPGVKERLEQLIGRAIAGWENHDANGVFQICLAGEKLAYHCDSQVWAAVIYLTPDAPPQAGTTLIRSKATRGRTVQESAALCGVSDEDAEKLMFENDAAVDGTRWEAVDVLGNVYNRCVIWKARAAHCPSAYFGNSLEAGRLFQIFFWD